MNNGHMTRWATIVLLAGALAAFAAGCAGKDKSADEEFFTSGSREADQRADQEVAKAQQLRGEGEQEQPERRSLYERLGGEKGVSAIVEDFVARAMADPRVNWERKGVRRGGVTLRRGQSVEWQATGENVAQLKKHLAQFLAVATGGPPAYDGKAMRDAHTGLRITNAEFDASIGDLKATLDNLGIPIDEQKELLAVVESTRPQVVGER